MAENNTTYDFTYIDNEGDLFQSNDHETLADAKKEVKRLWNFYDGDMQVKETWIYRNGEFKGRWNY